jgi:ribosomal protein S18 acetylase RimI-like enzyme
MSGERSYWFALLDDKIIGFVDFKVMPFHPGSDGKFARIFDLFITPSMHRRGYGTQLAHKTITLAIEQGASNIELNVLPNNGIALDFWRSLGFNLHLYLLSSNSRVRRDAPYYYLTPLFGKDGFENFLCSLCPHLLGEFNSQLFGIKGITRNRIFHHLLTIYTGDDAS